MSIYRKLAAMRDEVGVIEKHGHNAHHRYNYVRAEDVTHRARELFSEHGLFLAPQCIGHERHDTLTVARLAFTVVDIETGEEAVFAWTGEGSDKQDKGVYKAYTGGLKYFLMHLLMIPSTEDPEASSGAGERAAPAASTDAPQCPKCSGPMWDNRNDKRSPKSPDFKCKDKGCGEGIWLSDADPPPGVDPGTGEITPAEKAELEAAETPKPPEQAYTVEEQVTLIARLRTLKDLDDNVTVLEAKERKWVEDRLRDKKPNFPLIAKGLDKLEAKAKKGETT